MAIVAAVAQKFIVSSIKRGIGANQTLSILQGKGLGYRRADFLSDYRRLAGIPKKANSIKFIRDGFKISEGLYTEAQGFQKNKYKYVTKVRVHKPETGETFEIYNVQSGSRARTVGRIKETAFEKINPKMEGSNFTVESVVVEEAWKRGALKL